SALAGHALDQDALSAQGEAEIVGEADDAAVFDAGFGLEFEGGDDRAGVDLRDLPEDFEFRVLCGQNLGDDLELVFVYGLLLVGTVEQARGREFVTARDFGEDRFRPVLGVGAVADCDFDSACDWGGQILRRRGEGGVVYAFLGDHAIDAGAGGWGCGLHAWDLPLDVVVRRITLGFLARNFWARRRVARGHELCGDSGSFGAAFFEFFLLTLALALVLPVLEAISERQDEGEAGGRPEFNCREREGGGEVEGDG